MIQCKHIQDSEVIEACRQFHAGLAPMPDLALPYPAKVILTKMSKLHRRGLIEYGVSLRTAWPTELGLSLIERTNRP